MRSTERDGGAASEPTCRRDTADGASSAPLDDRWPDRFAAVAVRLRGVHGRGRIVPTWRHYFARSGRRRLRPDHPDRAQPRVRRAAGRRGRRTAPPALAPRGGSSFVWWLVLPEIAAILDPDPTSRSTDALGLGPGRRGDRARLAGPPQFVARRVAGQPAAALLLRSWAVAAVLFARSAPAWCTATATARRPPTTASATCWPDARRRRPRHAITHGASAHRCGCEAVIGVLGAAVVVLVGASCSSGPSGDRTLDVGRRGARSAPCCATSATTTRWATSPPAATRRWSGTPAIPRQRARRRLLPRRSARSAWPAATRSATPSTGRPRSRRWRSTPGTTAGRWR